MIHSTSASAVSALGMDDEHSARTVRILTKFFVVRNHPYIVISCTDLTFKSNSHLVFHTYCYHGQASFLPCLRSTRNRIPLILTDGATAVRLVFVNLLRNLSTCNLDGLFDTGNSFLYASLELRIPGHVSSFVPEKCKIRFLLLLYLLRFIDRYRLHVQNVNANS